MGKVGQSKNARVYCMLGPGIHLVQQQDKSLAQRIRTVLAETTVSRIIYY